MTKEKVITVSVVLAIVLVVMIFLTSFIVVHEKKQTWLAEQKITEIQDDLNDAKKILEDELKKSESLRLERDALTGTIDSLKKQIGSLTIENQELKRKLVVPPPIPVQKPVVKKPIKKKRIPYDIAPSQQ